MKTKIILILVLSFLFITNITNTATAHAASNTQVSSHTTIIPEPDGGYYVKKTVESPSNNISTYSNITTKSHTTYYTYYNSKGVACWLYSLTGTFRINYGVSATCTDATANLSIYNSSYSFNSENHSHSGNTATGTIKINYNGRVKSKTASITCDKYGNFS